MKKKSMHAEDSVDEGVEISSKSVYADLGFKNHEELEAKSNLVIEISKVIKKKKLTQTDAADIFGISQPKLSELLSGRFRGYSIERLIRFLNELGQDVDIVVKSKPRSRRARVAVYHSSNASRHNVSLTAKVREVTR